MFAVVVMSMAGDRVLSTWENLDDATTAKAEYLAEGIEPGEVTVIMDTSIEEEVA